MSDSIFVMLNKENMPAAEVWAEQLKKDGFYAFIDTTWEEEKDSDGSYGFRPCKYYNLEDIGFELDMLSREKNIEDFEEWDDAFPQVKEFDLAVVFGIRSEYDSYIATIAAAVLAKMSNGIYFDVDVPMEIDSIYKICKEIDEKVKNHVKRRKTNVYKLFQKKLKNEFATYLQLYGFQYHKGKYRDVFYGFHDNLIFQITFELSSYKNRIDTFFNYFVPLMKSKFEMYDDNLVDYSFSGQDFNIENLEYKEKKEIEKILDKYLEEMKIFFENYIHIIFSKTVKSDYMESFIKHVYNDKFDDYLENKGEEHPSDIYIVSFQNEGKTEDDWSDEDSEAIDKLVKDKQQKEFPYELIKKDILESIDDNKLVYQEKIERLSKEGFFPIKIEADVKSVSVKDLINNKETKIEQRLIELGYKFEKYKYDKAVYKKDNMIIEVEVKDDLFLEFKIEQYGIKRRYPFFDMVGRSVRLHDKGYVKYGWLVGCESTMLSNIQDALIKLRESLDSMDEYIEKIIAQDKSEESMRNRMLSMMDKQRNRG